MTANIQASNSNTNHDNRLNSSSAAKESQDNAVTANEPTDANQPDPATVRSKITLQLSKATENQMLYQKIADQIDDDYNGISNVVLISGNSNSSDHQAIQRVKAVILDPEAESAASATTLMIIFIAIMGGFQRAKMNDVVSNLQSIVSKISTRIAEMKTDMIAAFQRDMTNFGGELLLNGVSLGVSIGSLVKTQPLRSELISEHKNLAGSYEYESLKATKAAIEAKASPVDPKVAAKLSKSDKLQVTDIQSKMDKISEEFKKNGEVPQSNVFKTKSDILQTRVAFHETRAQFLNSIASVLKGSFTAAAACLNADATKAKINEQQAEMDKSQLDIILRFLLEQIPVYRDAQAKFLNEAEQIMNMRANDSKAATTRMA